MKLVPPIGLTVQQQRDWYAVKCDELADEVAGLRREQVRDTDAAFLAYVRVELATTWQIATAIVVLSSGSFLDDFALMQRVSGKADEYEDLDATAKVLICRTRRFVPIGSIVTCHGRGYQATPALVEFVASLRKSYAEQRRAA